MRVPLAWLTLLPFVGELMRIVLLFKGNEWAWQNRRWDSREQFKRVQTWWNRVGVAVFLLLFALSLFAASRLVEIIQTSPYFAHYMAEYQQFVFRLLDLFH